LDLPSMLMDLSLIMLEELLKCAKWENKLEKELMP
jgi:hypothetical protein